jgi:hypothetical protein
MDNLEFMKRVIAARTHSELDAIRRELDIEQEYRAVMRQRLVMRVFWSLAILAITLFTVSYYLCVQANGNTTIMITIVLPFILLKLGSVYMMIK